MIVLGVIIVVHVNDLCFIGYLLMFWSYAEDLHCWRRPLSKVLK